MTKVKLLTIMGYVLIATARSSSQTDSAALFTLEIPSAGFRLAGNGSATLPPGNPTHFQIHVAVNASQLGYGNIFARINTESAAVVMTTSATTTGVRCDFDLTRRQGFRLRPGRNSVEILVQDLRGRFRYASFLLDMSAQTAATRAAIPISVSTGLRQAVIVGISRYRDAKAGVKNLPFADRDATTIRNLLVSPEGGYRAEHVKLLLNEDATAARIRETLQEIAINAAPDDLVTFYIAGHAVADPDDQRRSFLLAHDSRAEALGETAIPFAELEDFFGRALKAKVAVTYLDVAHSNALATSQAGANSLVHQYLLRYAGTRSRVALAAADAGETSWEAPDGAAPTSSFARFIASGLRGGADVNRDGTVTFAELKTFVREQVRTVSGGQQNPAGTESDGEAIALTGLRVRQ